MTILRARMLDDQPPRRGFLFALALPFLTRFQFCFQFAPFQVPVQRVTKYPLLLSRLQKVTPEHHHDRNDIKLAQDKIEAALEQMNKVTNIITKLDQ